MDSSAKPIDGKNEQAQTATAANPNTNPVDGDTLLVALGTCGCKFSGVPDGETDRYAGSERWRRSTYSYRLQPGAVVNGQRAVIVRYMRNLRSGDGVND